MYTPEQVTHAIVVLGNELNPDGTMKLGLMHRLDMAAELYQQGVAPVIITSGWYAFDIPVLQQYCEAVIAKQYLHEVHGYDIPIMCEPDSKSVPENLLFTRVRFPNLQQLTIVTGELFAERALFFAHMFFTERVEIECRACVDGLGDPERQPQLVGDAKCTLKEMTPGDLDFLLLSPTPEGRLQSRWNELRLEHHSCPYWRGVHPSP